MYPFMYMGYISAAEKAAVDQAIQSAEAAKQAALDEVNKLPRTGEKENLVYKVLGGSLLFILGVTLLTKNIKLK